MSGASFSEQALACVYGAPSAELTPAPAGARQVSPLVPGATTLEEIAPESLDAMVVAAPAGTVERRYALALSLRTLKPGGSLVALALKEKGGSRLGAELKAFGCAVEETGKRHHRICRTVRPIAPQGLDAAIAEGAPRQDAEGWWTQPGLFSWDRLDPGSALLVAHLPKLAGAGIELGAGTGAVAKAVLTQAKVTRLDLVDIDRRAVDAARRNLADPRAAFHWADARSAPLPEGLDFVVMNPPFHEAGGAENKALGQDFIRTAHARLRKGGVLSMVANRHLPYEAVLGELFSKLDVKADRAGFKVLEARK